MKLKGIVLAGGTGSRLYPLTKSINKHILPVYDRPMIYYPIESLVNSGITEIILVAGGNHIGQFIDLLGDGSEFGCSINYVVQSNPGGIAEAILLTESYIGSDNMVVILGDNIFTEDISPWVDEFIDNYMGKINNTQCHIVCKEVNSNDAVNYGILSDNDNITIYEKPDFPLKYPDKTFLAVTGLYMYTSDVFSKIKRLSPSKRGELEVSDLNNIYASTGDLTYSVTNKLWIDCGVSIDHMLKVANDIKNLKE